MLAVTLVVFIGGVAYRVHQFFSLTREVRIDPSTLPKTISDAVKKRERDEFLRIDSATDMIMKWRLRLKRTMLGKAPFFSAVTIVFHTLLIFLPIVTMGHNILLDDYFGFNFPTLSEATVDNLTLLLIILGGVFFLRRILVAKVRSVTTYRDWIAWTVTMAPFVTGYLAYHQIFDYNTILLIHIIAGELMLIAIPFTKLVHMPFFFFARFLIRNELTLGSGTRKWVETT
jgi:nitrate reductase gamma subunit